MDAGRDCGGDGVWTRKGREAEGAASCLHCLHDRVGARGWRPVPEGYLRVRRRSGSAIVAKATLAALALCAAVAASARAADDLAAGDQLRIRTLTLPYDTGAVFAMAHEKVPIAVTAPPTRLFSLEAPHGALIA